MSDRIRFTISRHGLPALLLATVAIFTMSASTAKSAAYINFFRFADGTGYVSTSFYNYPSVLELERGGAIIASNTAYSTMPLVNVVPQAGDVLRAYKPPGNLQGSITFDGLPTIEDACIGSRKFSGNGSTEALFGDSSGAKPSPYPPGKINRGTYLQTTVGGYEVSLERPLEAGYIAYLRIGKFQGQNAYTSYIERTVRDCSPPPDPCARPKYGVTVKANRQLRLKKLRKGLPLRLSATHASKATVRVSLRKQDRRRLKIRGSNVVGRKTVSLKSSKEKTVRVRLSSKFRKARRLRKGRVRLKVTVVGLAKGVPSWRKLKRRVPVSVVVKGRGKVGKKQVSSTKKVLGISPCAKRLKVKIGVPRRGSIRKGFKVTLSAGGKASGKLKLAIRKKDMLSLGLSKKDVTAYSGKVSLSADKKIKKKIRIKKKLAAKLARALNRKKRKKLRGKLTVSLKGSDGQRTRESKTVRLK